LIEKHVETHDDQLTVGLTPAETDRFYHEHTLRVGAMLGLVDPSTEQWNPTCEDIARAVERISTKTMSFEGQPLTEDADCFFTNQNELFTGVLSILERLVSPDQSKATPSSTGASAPADPPMSADKAELLRKKAEIERKLVETKSPSMTSNGGKKIRLKEQIEQAKLQRQKEREDKKKEKEAAERKKKEDVAAAKKAREDAAKKAREDAERKKKEREDAKKAKEEAEAKKKKEREDAKKAREDAKAANEAMSEEQKKAAQRAKREEAKAAKEAARAAEALRAARLARQAQLEKSAEDADRRLRRFNGEGSGDEALTDEDLPLMVEPPSAAAAAAAPEKRCSTTLKFDYYGVTQSVPCTGQAEVPFPSHGSQPRFCLDESSDLLGFLAKISFSKTQSTCGACHSTVASLLKEIKKGSMTIEEAVLAWEGFCVISAGCFKFSDAQLSEKVWWFSKIAASHLPDPATNIKSVFSKEELANAKTAIKQNEASKQQAKEQAKALQAQLDAINEQLALS